MHKNTLRRRDRWLIGTVVFGIAGGIAALTGATTNAAPLDPPAHRGDERLTKEGRALLEMDLKESIARHHRLTPTKEMAAKAGGLSANADPIEKGPGRFSHPSAVPAMPARGGEARSDDALYQAEVTGALAEELKRKPTRDEIQRRIARGDADTAAVNKAFAAKRAELARLYKQGRHEEARALEDGVERGLGRTGRPSPHDGEAPRLTKEERRALKSRMLYTLANRKAASPAAPPR